MVSTEELKNKGRETLVSYIVAKLWENLSEFTTLLGSVVGVHTGLCTLFGIALSVCSVS